MARRGRLPGERTALPHRRQPGLRRSDAGCRPRAPHLRALDAGGPGRAAARPSPAPTRGRRFPRRHPDEHVSAGMDFDLGQLGRWTDDRPFVVTPDATIAYAAATNDLLPEHASGAVAPPMFAVVPALMGVATDAMDRIWVSKRAGDYDTRSLHGEQSLFVHEPIVPGMTLRSRAAPVGLERKSTGTLMVTRTETRDERDRVLNT